MVAWKQSLKPAEMAQVASYVLTLVGTTPTSPKEPEGEIWIDPDAKTTPKETMPPVEQEKDSTDLVMNGY